MLIPIWTTKDGRQIPVNQMSDDHLQKCIAKIRRSRRGWRRNCLTRLELELIIRAIERQ